MGSVRQFFHGTVCINLLVQQYPVLESPQTAADSDLRPLEISDA